MNRDVEARDIRNFFVNIRILIYMLDRYCQTFKVIKPEIMP